MYNIGLLIINQPLSKGCKISNYLKQIKHFVKNILYVKLVQDFPYNGKVNNFNELKYLSFLPSIYLTANYVSPSLDIRVLMDRKVLTLNYHPEIVFSNNFLKDDLINYVKHNFDFSNNYVIHFLEDSGDDLPFFDFNQYNNVVIGGTFDNLHNGHKFLLSHALIRCKSSLTIGITEQEFIKNKILYELIDPISDRIKYLKNYLTEVNDKIEYKIYPLRDPYGPSIEDDKLELIVVTKETLKTGEKINQIRKERNLKEMDLLVIDLLPECQKISSFEEDKVSSSSLRMRKLGTLLREPETRLLNPRPYLIGLTGGIASGKSTICEILSKLGAAIINCDFLAHETYSKPDLPAFIAIVDYFGSNVINPENGLIDRKKLGLLAFSEPNKLQMLNHIVWKETEKLVNLRINELKDHYKVIVLEVALLLEAGWEKNVHQIWVTIASLKYIIERLKNRNLTEEEAIKRISSQICNESRIKKANVVFCTNWEKEFTTQQVNKAWNMLKEKFINDL